MRPIVCILGSLLLCSIPVLTRAEPARGIVIVYTGSAKQFVPQTFGGTCPSTGCQGDLVTCSANEAFFAARLTFSLLQGICDDSGTTPCAGRATALEEGCFNLTPPPAGTDRKLNGAVFSLNARGRGRYCFDEGGQADCTGTAPGGTVIGEDTTVYQFRQSPPQTGPSQVTVEQTVHDTKEFTLNGKKTRLKIGKVLISQFTAEPNPGSNCGGVGCGFAGNSVRVD